MTRKEGTFKVTAIAPDGVDSESFEPGEQNPFAVAQRMRQDASDRGEDGKAVDVTITGWRVGRRG